MGKLPTEREETMLVLKSIIGPPSQYHVAELILGIGTIPARPCGQYNKTRKTGKHGNAHVRVMSHKHLEVKLGHL